MRQPFLIFKIAPNLIHCSMRNAFIAMLWKIMDIPEIPKFQKYLFYMGWQYSMRKRKTGKPMQLVRHAMNTSILPITLLLKPLLLNSIGFAIPQEWLLMNRSHESLWPLTSRDLIPLPRDLYSINKNKSVSNEFNFNFNIYGRSISRCTWLWQPIGSYWTTKWTFSCYAMWLYF